MDEPPVTFVMVSVPSAPTVRMPSSLKKVAPAAACETP